MLLNVEFELVIVAFLYV